MIIYVQTLVTLAFILSALNASEFSLLPGQVPDEEDVAAVSADPPPRACVYRPDGADPDRARRILDAIPELPDAEESGGGVGRSGGDDEESTAVSPSVDQTPVSTYSDVRRGLSYGVASTASAAERALSAHEVEAVARACWKLRELRQSLAFRVAPVEDLPEDTGWSIGLLLNEHKALSADVFWMGQDLVGRVETATMMRDTALRRHKFEQTPAAHGNPEDVVARIAYGPWRRNISGGLNKYQEIELYVLGRFLRLERVADACNFSQNAGCARAEEIDYFHRAYREYVEWQGVFRSQKLSIQDLLDGRLPLGIRPSGGCFCWPWCW